jgi:hypothetical protein
MAVRPVGRPLPPADPEKPYVEVRFLVDREMDTALRDRVREQNVTRSAHLRKLIDRDLKRAASRSGANGSENPAPTC